MFTTAKNVLGRKVIAISTIEITETTDRLDHPNNVAGLDDGQRVHTLDPTTGAQAYESSG